MGVKYQSTALSTILPFVLSSVLFVVFARLVSLWLPRDAKYEKTDIKVKLNMGKSCVRFKKEAHIPYELIGQLVAKVTPEQWVATYEANIKNK